MTVSQVRRQCLEVQFRFCASAGMVAREGSAVRPGPFRPRRDLLPCLPPLLHPTTTARNSCGGNGSPPPPTPATTSAPLPSRAHESYRPPSIMASMNRSGCGVRVSHLGALTPPLTTALALRAAWTCRPTWPNRAPPGREPRLPQAPPAHALAPVTGGIPANRQWVTGARRLLPGLPQSHRLWPYLPRLPYLPSRPRTARRRKGSDGFCSPWAGTK